LFVLLERNKNEKKLVVVVVIEDYYRSCESSIFLPGQARLCRSGGSLPKLASTCMHGLVKVHAVVFDLKHGWPGTLADMHYFQLQQAVLKAWHGHGCSIANDRLQAVCM